MPEYIGSANGQAPNRFPLAARPGEHYVAPANKTEDGMVHAHTVQTILVEAKALYELWRDVESIPLWQEHVVSVTATSKTESHWVLGDPEDPKGKRVEFDSTIVEDVPGVKIAWKSITKGVEESGGVTFAPHISGRGTVVTLEETMKVPGGLLGSFAAGIVERSPGQTVIENLRHFKELAESGEIPSVKGQPHGPRGLTGKAKEWMFGESNPTPPGTSVNA